MSTTLPYVDVGADVQSVKASTNTTCVITVSDQAKCWGKNNNGQLGLGNTNTIGDNEHPSTIGTLSLGSTVTEIEAANDHTCASVSTGDVFCWGAGSAGRLGYGNLNTIGDNEAPQTVGPITGINLGVPVSAPAITYDVQDRLITFGTRTFTYNLNGELTSETDSSTSVTKDFVYDVLGNLKSVVLPAKTVNYLVDAHNRRIVKKNGSTIANYFVWNKNNQLVGLTDGSGQLVSSFVYGSKAHVPDYMITSTTEYQIVSNHLGSPVSVIDKTTGTVAQEIKYDEFGNITADTNPGFTPFGFAGCLYDVETKLCRFGARDYDAAVGRWLSKDPILFAGGDSNLYGYVMQDPINLIDPSGLAPGDSFGSESAAGYDAINYINNASISLNREFAGTIYRNAQGGYSYTNPLMGGPAGANPGPISALTTAIYHTHAGFDPRYDNENFSGTDTRFSTGRGLGSYLGTPFGSTQYQGPNGNITRMSGPNSCGR